MRTMPEILASKRDAQELSPEDFNFICDNINEIPREQLGALMMAIKINNLSKNETNSLTKAMIDSGTSFKQAKGRVDKHSTGGVGDKMSIILAPALRAAGATVPMLAGRGLAHTGGTIDKLESIPGFNTGLTLNQMKNNPCFISRQTDEIAPADRILYSIRDITATVAQIGLITASIISKKAAEGLEKLVLDVKCGRAAFMKTEFDARELAQMMVNTGSALGIDVIAQITAMDTPIGTMFGNAHEIAECIDCLKGGGPKDTMELVYLQADALGYDISQFIKDGSALKEFNAMCVRQGVEQGIADQLCSDPWSVLQCGKNTTHIRATKEGYVSDIDALALGEVLCVIGAGRTGVNSIIDHGIGAVLNKIIGSKVAEGEPVITIDSPGTIPSELKNKLLGAITISDQEVELKPRLIATIYSD